MNRDLFEEAELPVLKVGELIGRVRAALYDEFGLVCVEGEVGSVFRSRPGHVYFDLKDADAQLRCVLFRLEAARLPCDLEEGMQVRALGNFDVYAARGALQLVVESVQPVGEGALRIAFERLKERLRDEGLFDPEAKRPLPYLPRRIGLVTSRGGAALHDFVRGLRARGGGVEVVLCDARVQGEGSWRDLVRALHRLDADDTIEVIVLTRGGGSLEDLWSFNREELVRAIFELGTPVVSAIGHEVDVVLTDLVADARAATPTAAAACVTPDRAELRGRIAGARRRLLERQRGQLRELRHQLDGLRRGLVHPSRRLAELRRRLDAARARLGQSVRGRRDRLESRLASAGGRLDALSPLAVLGRGYSIVRREADDTIVRAASDVETGVDVRVRLGRGSLRATVKDRTES